MPGYKLIKGSAIDITDPRLNVYVKDGMVVEVMEMRTEVPSVKLKVGQTIIIMVYREWAKDGDQGTKDFERKGGQNDRWEGFVKEWSKVT